MHINPGGGALKWTEGYQACLMSMDSQKHPKHIFPRLKLSDDKQVRMFNGVTTIQYR